MTHSEETSIGKVFFDLGVILSVLGLVSVFSYSFFHNLTEVFSSVVALGIFMVTWNSRRFINNHYFQFLGIAYLFVGLFQLLHVLTFSTFGLDAYFPVEQVSGQFWLASLMLAAATYSFAPIFIGRKINTRYLFLFYAALSVFVLLLVLYWQAFPDIYDSQESPTMFGRASVYAVNALLSFSIFMLYRHRKAFDVKVLSYIYASLAALIVSNFLIYSSPENVFSYPEMSGHVLVVISSYLFYVGIVETGLMKPYRLLFKEIKDKEKALEQSESAFRSLVEQSPEAMIVHNQHGILYINPAGISLLGCKTSEPILGSPLRKFINPDDRDYFKYKFDDLKSNDFIFPLREARIQTLDERQINVEIGGRLISYAGQPAIQSTVRDLSSRTIAIHDAPDHIIMTNPRGFLIYANRAAERMTGYSWAEMDGRTPALWGSRIKTFGSASDEPTLCAWDSISVDNPNFSGEVENTRKNGEKYTAELHISPVFDEQQKIIHFLAIERDITKLKEVDRAKTEFISLAAHELRTPLASISLATELLLRGTGGELDDRQQKYLSEIHASSRRMSELIHTFLNISRIEMGTFAVKKTPLKIVDEIDQVMKAATPLLEKKQLELIKNISDDLPAVVNFDGDILRMTLENFISNAIRYTAPTGRITVGLKRGAVGLVLSVQDTGCGIPANQQKQIFTKMFRADNAKEVTHEGLGLGLYMVNSITRRAGTKIWFESKEGQGSTFFLLIPLS